MPTGKHRPATPAKKDHMANFELAMKDALDGWNAHGDVDQRVTLEVTVTPNPGGIKEYRVVIGEGP
jgi:hypothetical protein